MMNTMFNKGMLPVLETGLHFSTARHKGILQNLANANTPFYKAVDAPVEEFRSQLKRSMDRRDRRPVALFSFENGLDVRTKRAGGTGLDVRYEENRSELPLNHNENNVNVEMEMVRLAENTGMHNAIAELLQQQFRLLDDAIRARGAAA